MILILSISATLVALASSDVSQSDGVYLPIYEMASVELGCCSNYHKYDGNWETVIYYGVFDEPCIIFDRIIDHIGIPEEGTIMIRNTIFHSNYEATTVVDVNFSDGSSSVFTFNDSSLYEPLANLLLPHVFGFQNERLLPENQYLLDKIDSSAVVPHSSSCCVSPLVMWVNFDNSGPTTTHCFVAYTGDRLECFRCRRVFMVNSWRSYGNRHSWGVETVTSQWVDHDWARCGQPNACTVITQRGRRCGLCSFHMNTTTTRSPITCR